MEAKNLEYIYNEIKNKGMQKNIYKEKIDISVQEMYIKYLNNSEFKYKLTNPEKKRLIRPIKLMRKDESTIETIRNPIYPTNSFRGIEIVRNKLKTENYLKKFDINTPNSKVYKANQMQIAREEFFKNSNSNAVIKPLNLSLGRGVVTNITEERFEYNWDISRESINYSNHPLLVQNYLEGFEARATIIEGGLLSIVARIPAFVYGNGTENISELIDLKNEQRLKCNYLKNMEIKKSKSVIEFLHAQSKSLEYIPEPGEFVLLSAVSNTSYGGETIDITNMVSQEIKEIGLNAVACLPSINTAGVDIIMKSFDDKDPYVLEINTYPFLTLAQYTTYGNQVNGAAEYINSVIAKDQFLNPKFDKYNIRNSDKYIQNYLSFNNRQIKLNSL